MRPTLSMGCRLRCARAAADPGFGGQSRQMDRVRSRLGRALSELDRRRWELGEAMLWTHHVADLYGADVLTSTLDRPVAPKSRAERVARLLPGVGPSIFDGPSFTLTPRFPFQASPTAALQAYGALQYSASLSQIWWSVPEGGDDIDRQVTFTVAALPAQPSIASIALIGNSYTGVIGQVVLASNLGPGQATVLVGDVYSAHTVDLVINPVTSAIRPDHTLISVQLQQGIQYLGFESVSFYPMAPLVTL